MNESDIYDVFQSIYTTIITSIQKSLGKGSGWIIDSVIDHTISISKVDKDFAKRLDFKDIKFPVKTRDIQKIEEKNSTGISVFSYENKVKYPIHVSKK